MTSARIPPIARTGQYITRCPTNNLNTPKKLPFPIACCLALEWKDSLTQRLLHGRAVIRILSSSKRYFQYEKIKSVSPSGHVIFCLFYRYRLNFHIKNFLIHFRNSQNSHVSQNVTYRNILTRERYMLLTNQIQGFRIPDAEMLQKKIKSSIFTARGEDMIFQ